MNDTFTRLLANVPGVDKSADAINSLALNGAGTVSLQNNTLYITSGSTSKTIDLNGITVSQMVSQLPSGITVTLYQDGMAELLMLPYQATNATLPVTFEIATSPTWIVTETLARLFDANRQSLANQSAQLNLPAATSRILDWWGASVDIPRFADEPDSLYANRILLMKFTPNVNNVAIVNLLQGIGYFTSVTDTTPSNFLVNIGYPVQSISGFTYSLEQMKLIVTSAKAAGTIATIQQTFIDSANADFLHFSLTGNASFMYAGHLLSGGTQVYTSYGAVQGKSLSTSPTANTGTYRFPPSGTFLSGVAPFTLNTGSLVAKALGFASFPITGSGTSFACGVYACGEEVA